MSLKESLIDNKWRYITSSLLIVSLALIFYLNNIFLIWSITGIIYMVGFYESLRLFNLTQSPIMYVFALAAWILAGLNDRPIESAIFIMVILTALLIYKKNFKPQQMLPFIYPTIPFLVIFAIYKDFGARAVIWLIVITSLSDTVAYFGGKIFGKTPLASISPKKTLEGSVIGLAIATVIGSLIGMGELSGNFLISLVISFAISLGSILGDLYESYLKRNVGLKDSGKILPGHGGVLDRADSLLFGAIVLHFLLFFLKAYKETSSVILL